MNKWISNGLYVLILAVFIAILYFSRIKATKSSKLTKKSYFFIFLIGVAGWTSAFLLRLIPLQLLQVLSIFLLGGDLTDIDSIVALSSHPFVIFWGPLLAGIFEGGARYLCFKAYKKSYRDAKNMPFYLGLGWTAGEILVLFLIGLPSLTALSTTNLSIAILERVVVSVAHIVLSYYAFYALYEPKGKKISLGLSMAWHFILDFMIVLWIILFSSWAVSHPYLYVLTLEGSFILIVVLATLIGIKYWFPLKHRQWEELEESLRSTPQFKPAATKDDIQIDSDFL